MGVNRKSNQGPQVRSWLSSQDCIKLHKLTIFPADAAEKQCFYMQQTVKKPQRVTIRQYMACMGILNDYLAFLPMVFNSFMAVEGTKKGNVPFDEADLARIILNSVPVSWMNQHNITHSTLPESQGPFYRTLKQLSMSWTRSTRLVSRQRRRRHPLTRSPREAPRSILLLEILVNESRRKASPQSSASTAR